MQNKKGYFEVADGIWGIKDIFVNVYLIENRILGGWVLIDAGLKTTAPKIRRAVKALFNGEAPKAIILTHGHFDHVGSLKILAKEWNVPVYAHILEKPYLTGLAKYPPADPTVGGGMMAWMSFLFPRTSSNIKLRFKVLSSDMSVPFLTGWKYIETPGHSPGHISLLRESDNVLIAGDALVTTIQESVFSVMTEYKKLCGPPKYFTIDWDKAKESAQKIAKLHPSIIASGHGKPMTGVELISQLNEMYTDFDSKAIPSTGRYVDDPAITDEHGVVYIPPSRIKKPVLIVLGITAIIAGTIILSKRKRRLDII